MGAELAELASRLRQRASGGHASAPDAWPNRLGASARCWRRVGEETGEAAFGTLADGLETLIAALQLSPPTLPDLPGRLHVVDSGLSRLLEAFDAGRAGAELAADPAWPVLAAEVRGGQGVGTRTHAGGRTAVAGGTVALLVASPFLAEALLARLVEAGRNVLTITGPEQALPLLRAAGPPVLFLGDNEEPTHHLRRLRDLLGPEAFLVLVGPADVPPGQERRARAAGADAVWPEPWSPDRLPRPRAAGDRP